MRNPFPKKGFLKRKIMRFIFRALVLSLFILACAPAASFAGQETAEHPWKTRAELSYVNTSGNTDTSTFAVKASIKKEAPVNRYFFNSSYRLTQNRNEETSNRLTLDGRYERVLTERTFGLFTAWYSRDRFSGYDSRVFAGPGAGRDFIRTERHLLQGLAILLYNHDEFSVGEEGTDDYVSAKATAKYEFKARENVKLTETLDYSASLEETGRYFLDSVTSVKVKINAHLSLGVNYTINYQNEPPSEELQHTDTTLLTTLIVDF